MITVRQQRIDEDVFMEKRKEVLALWPTGKEVDLEEAVVYQKALPDDRRFHKLLQRFHEEGLVTLFPRQGTPLVEDEISLIRSLNEMGIYLIPFTTDSYTRNLQLDKVERALEDMRNQHSLSVSQFQVEIRMLHKRIDLLEQAASLDAMSRLLNRAETEAHILAAGAESFSVLLLRAQGIQAAERRFR